MSENIIISLHIHSQEITPEQLNCIVAFASQFDRENCNKIEIIVDKLPLRLNGKISHLTSNARRYFYGWNAMGTMRNIRIAKGVEMTNDDLKCPMCKSILEYERNYTTTYTTKVKKITKPYKLEVKNEIS